MITKFDYRLGRERIRMNAGMRIEERNHVFSGESSKIRRWGDIRSENRVLGNGSTKVLLGKFVLEELFILFQNGRFDYSSTFGFPNTCSFTTLVICVRI